MIIKGKNIQISFFNLLIWILLLFMSFFYIILSNNFESLVWIIPVLIMLILIPLTLNYLNQVQYQNLIPVYKKEARFTKISAINSNMTGEIVKVEGIIKDVKFVFFNRPRYTIEDKTGAIAIIMFTNPSRNIKKGDNVFVLGQLIKKMIVTGKPAINAVCIERKD